MFTTTCGACGTPAHFDESEVPPSGFVTTCAHCASELSVVPPGMGLLSTPTAESNDGSLDLPEPKTRVREDLPDLPVPVGPKPRNRDVPDLLAPVGPRPTKGVSDLLAPVGPRPTKGMSDLLTPVSPRTQPPTTAPPSTTPPFTSNRATTDLLAPVGPSPTRNVPDLLQPVGPSPIRNAPDLLQPVGPQPVRNLPDLLQPVGPVPVKSAPDYMAPVGPKPTKGIDLPAPKGFFDEAPPPSPISGGRADAFDADDDLDVLPAGSEYHSPEVEPGFRDHSQAGPVPGAPGFTMDDLDLGSAPQTPPPAYEEPAGYGEVDLPRAPPDAGLVSFSAPTGKTSVNARPIAVDIIEAPKKKPGTMAGDLPAEEKAQIERRKARRVPKALVIGVLVVVALAAGAYYVYTSVELTIFGIMTQPAEERQSAIARGTAETRRLLASSDAGHWGRAAQAAEKVIALDKLAMDPKALAAQAYAAEAYEEGLNLKADREKADALVAALLKTGGRGREVEKAVALRSVLDAGKAAEAATALANVARSGPTDPDAPLFAGWAALEARNFDQAKAQFDAALKLSPDRQPALVGLGRAEVGHGDTAKAKEAFQRVFDKYPDHKNYGAWLALTELNYPPRDPTGRRERELAVLTERAPERETANPRDRARALTLYGDEAMAASRWAQAAERYRLALGLDPHSVDALVGAALAVVEQRSHEAATASLVDARKALEAALQIEPKHVGALVGLVRINLIEGRAADAREIAAKASDAGERVSSVHYWTGKVLEDPTINDLDGAEKEFKRAIELAPDEYAAYVALSQLDLGRARVADKAGKKAEAKAWTDKAVAVLGPIAEAAKTDKLMANILGGAYFGAKDYPHAEQWFRGALGVDASYVDARANLAATLEAENKLAEATSEWARAFAAAPKREDIALSLAGVYEKGRNYDSAERIYTSLLSTDGGNVPTARALAAAGRYNARRGLLDLAKKQGAALNALDPGNPAAIFLSGFVAFNENRLIEAEKAYHDAIALDPQAQYWDALARLHEKHNALGDAQTAYEQALRLDATFAPAYMGLGRVHLLRAKWGLALDALQQAAQLDPVSDEIWVGIGDAYAHSYKGAEAAMAYHEALKRNDKNAETYYKLGRVYDEAGESTQSVAAYRNAVSKAPQGAVWLPEALQFLGYRLNRNGDRAGACVAFKQFLTIAPKAHPVYNAVKHDSAACAN